MKITWNGDWNTLEVWCFLFKEVQSSEKAIPCVQSHDFYWDNKTIRWTRSIITLQWEWPKENFSVQYQYNNKQKCNENKERYKLGTYKLIQYQILQINIISTCILWQTVRRIANEILGVKGLSGVFYQRTGTCIEQSSHHSPWVTAWYRFDCTSIFDIQTKIQVSNKILIFISFPFHLFLLLNVFREVW